MIKNQSDPVANSRVVVDSAFGQQVPTVVIASQAPVSEKESKKKDQHLNLFQKLSRKLINMFFDFLETIVVALSIFVVVYLFLVQPHEVKGSSMEPNFQNNEYILTDKISYRFTKPHRGDVVIFKSPKNPDIDYIKRVIALPGEQVKVESGAVYVNNKKLPEKYLKDETNLFPGSFVQEGVNITVGEGDLFVLGDNRPHSSDSREFGPIPEKSIIGRAFIRYWPLPQAGILNSVQYNLEI